MNLRSSFLFAAIASLAAAVAGPVASAAHGEVVAKARATGTPSGVRASSAPSAEAETTPGGFPTTQAPVPYQGFPGTNTVPPLQQGGGDR